MKKILKQIEKYILQISKSHFCDPKTAPRVGGVYMIYEGSRIIYIGKAKNLNRRLNSDHISGESAFTTSTFRRSICNRDCKCPGRALLSWIKENCKFKYIEIPDADICHLTEAALITHYRHMGEPLLNH